MPNYFLCEGRLAHLHGARSLPQDKESTLALATYSMYSTPQYHLPSGLLSAQQKVASRVF